MTQAVTLCASCKLFRSWLHPDAPRVDGLPRSFCTSYPSGIPDAIVVAGYDHRTPFGGEQEVKGAPILYTPDPDKSELLALYDAISSRSVGDRSAEPKS